MKDVISDFWRESALMYVKRMFDCDKCPKKNNCYVYTQDPTSDMNCEGFATMKAYETGEWDWNRSFPQWLAWRQSRPSTGRYVVALRNYMFDIDVYDENTNTWEKHGDDVVLWLYWRQWKIPSIFEKYIDENIKD